MTARMWKDGMKRGIVYVEGKESAQRAMEACGRNGTPLPEGAMAVYSDKRGRAYAWQITFDIGRWEQVAAACLQ